MSASRIWWLSGRSSIIGVSGPPGQGFCEVEQGQSLKMNRGALREVERFAGAEVGAGRYCYPVVDEVEFCGSLIVCC